MVYAFLAVIVGVALFGIGQSFGGDTGGYIGLALAVVVGACINWLSQGKSVQKELNKSFNEFVKGSKTLIILGLIVLGILALIALFIGVFNWIASLSATTVIIILLVLILLK